MKRFCIKMEPIFTQNAENSCFVCFFVTDFDGIAISGFEGKRVFDGRVACAIIKVFYIYICAKRGAIR